MAVRHVDVVERVFGLSNRCATGDADALTELLGAYHEDARIDSYLADAAATVGVEAAIRNYFDEVATSYEEWQCMLDYVQDYGDRNGEGGSFKRPGIGDDRHTKAE